MIRLQDFVPTEDWREYGAYFDHVGRSNFEPIDLDSESPASVALSRARERVNVLDAQTEGTRVSIGDFMARMAVDDAVQREIIPE